MAQFIKTLWHYGEKKKALFLCEVPAVVLDVFTHISLRDGSAQQMTSMSVWVWCMRCQIGAKKKSVFWQLLCFLYFHTKYATMHSITLKPVYWKLDELTVR